MPFDHQVNVTHQPTLSNASVSSIKYLNKTNNFNFRKHKQLELFLAFASGYVGAVIK